MPPEQTLIFAALQPIAAALVGLVMGFWAGAYLMTLWRHPDLSSQKKFGYGAAVIGGMGGLPSAVAYELIKTQAVWCLIFYMITLLVPAALSYLSALRDRPEWKPPDPGSFER